MLRSRKDRGTKRALSAPCRKKMGKTPLGTRRPVLRRFGRGVAKMSSPHRALDPSASRQTHLSKRETALARRGPVCFEKAPPFPVFGKKKSKFFQEKFERSFFEKRALGLATESEFDLLLFFFRLSSRFARSIVYFSEVFSKKKKKRVGTRETICRFRSSRRSPCLVIPFVFVRLCPGTTERRGESSRPRVWQS